MLLELKKLACEFSSQPLTIGREMRDLLEASPGEFCVAATEILTGEEPERVKRYLVALLWTNNLLIPCLTDPSTPQKMAESIADLARRVDPQLAAKLVGFVLERTNTEAPECLERVLMLLKSMPDSASFRPLLTPLLRHPNARVRSKVALVAGEGNRNRTWFERRMLEEDPRVRANAIESAGQVVTEDLGPLLRSAALDSNNRVVGNALIALYRLGDPTALGSLYDLVSRPESAFRATGIWAMGETGDSRFLPVLGRILIDANETIKSASFRAIRKLRGKESEKLAPLDIRVLSKPVIDEREIKVTFTVSDGANAIHSIPPTQVRILLNGEQWFHYSVVEQESARKIAAAFLLSGSANRTADEREREKRAIEKCYESRRPGDSWSVALHNGADGAVRTDVLFGVRMETSEGSVMHSVSRLSDLQQVLEGRAGWKRLDFATTFVAVCQELRLSRFSAHLFVVDPDEGTSFDSGALIRAAQDARVTVHTACSRWRAALQDVCDATGGFLAPHPDLAASLPALHRGISHRYQMAVLSTGEVRCVQIAVRTPGAYGESAAFEIAG